MNNSSRSHRLKRLAFGFCIVFLIVFSLVPPGKAQGIIYGSSVPSGQVLDNNVILNGTTVTIDGTVNGDVIAIGNDVTLNGTVNGTLVTAGQNIVLNGTVDGNVLASGLKLEMGPAANIKRDLYFAGVQLVTQPGSNIGRDLYGVSFGAQLGGKVDRDVKAIIGPLDIAQWFANVTGLQIKLPSLNPPKTGRNGTGATAWTSSSIGSASWAVLRTVLVNRFDVGVHTDLSSQAQQPGTGLDLPRLQNWLFSLLRQLAALLILGLLTVWLMPLPLYWAVERVHSSPWRSAGYGLLVFVMGWFIAVLLFLIFVGLAIFFYSISLPNLGFLVGSVGLFSLGLAVTVFWLCITFASKIIVAFLVGSLLLKRFLPKIAQSRVWPLILGVVLYALLASIPYLGWVIATVVTFLGLGALWSAIPFGKKAGGEPTSPAEIGGVAEALPEA